MEIKSKHRSVARAPYMLYMPFSDMRNFVAMLPEDKKQGVEADYDTIHATVQGFNVGVRVHERVPYSRITYKDDGAPFQFTVDICFDADGGNPDSTDDFCSNKPIGRGSACQASVPEGLQSSLHSNTERQGRNYFKSTGHRCDQ